MKPSDFKKMIKEAVKEAIQEELKEILLEAVRAPKTVVNESVRDTYAQPHLSKPKQLSPTERRDMFAGMLSEMQTGGIANTSYQGTIDTTKPVDAINGALPEGQVGLDQIMSLMNK